MTVHAAATFGEQDIPPAGERTLGLVDPRTQHPENLIWKYHWTVSNELEKRSEGTLARALKMAEEK